MAFQQPRAPAFVRELLCADPTRMKAFAAAFWPHLVGREVASRTRVVKVENATLVVEVPDASWRRELHKMQPALLARLRELLGAAAPRRLGFMEARSPFSSEQARPSAPTAARVSSLPSATILQAAEAIPDAALREAFVRSATDYLSAFGTGGRKPPVRGGVS